MPPHLQIKKRLRGTSISTVTPPQGSSEYSIPLAEAAARAFYKSPLPSQSDLPIYVLNAAAFPDTKEVNYDELLPYVLARLPSEEQLIGGKGYEVVFFAGDEERTSNPKGRPGWGWIVQAYNALSRAMRKRLQKLYLVHERRWIRVLSEMFSTIVSPKFRRKVVHVSTLSGLALHMPLERLLIPPSVYSRDRKLIGYIHVPYASGRRAFGASNPLPTSTDGSPRLPRVLRETTTFLLAGENLDTQGLFRVNARASTLEVLKEAYDRGQNFIVWKEGDCVVAFPQWQEGQGEVMIDELDQVDGYGVHTAAGLIKMWYSQLREPIFPQHSYAFIERVYGGTEEPVGTETFLNLFGQSADWSQISKVSRMILSMHLLPLLATIAEDETNKMTARNLAVCFAPSLLCGSDPIQDARMCSIINKILEFGIENWNRGLAASFGMEGRVFEKLLKTPDAVQDREDPLDSSLPSSPAHPDQTEGILLLDQDNSDEDQDENEEEERPPLPPRVQIGDKVPESPSMRQTFKRKPAPPLSNPPRYSTITQAPSDVDRLPLYGLSLETETKTSGNIVHGETLTESPSVSNAQGNHLEDDATL